MPDEEQAKIEKILEARKAGAKGTRLRRSRNHAMIQAGLGAREMIAKRKMKLSELLEYIPENKHEVVKEWLTREN